jgi:hypothetical protein
VQIDALLADSVANAENKLYVLGAGWDRLSVPAFPARHPRIGIAALITVPYDQTGRDHQLTVRLEDADGHVQPIGPPQPAAEPGAPDRSPTGITATFGTTRSDTGVAGDEQIVPLALNLDGLVFSAPGRFRFVLGVAGADVKNLAFRVTQAG